MHFPIGDDLFRLGLLIAGISFALLLLFLVIGSVIRQKLNHQLEQEYGKKRH